MEQHDVTVTVKISSHILETVQEHLRSNARFEHMLAQRLGDDHPVQEHLEELAQVYLDIADACAATLDQHLADRQAAANG